MNEIIFGKKKIKKRKKNGRKRRRRTMGRNRSRKNERGERRKKEKIEKSTNLRGKALFNWNSKVIRRQKSSFLLKFPGMQPNSSTLTQ